MASPQKIPPSFSFYGSTGWRGHTPWSVSTKHLRCPHCPGWLSHRSSLRNHILRFQSRRHRLPSRSWVNGLLQKLTLLRRASEDASAAPAARQRRLGRGEPYTIGHEEFTILHSNVRGFISRVAELSARLRLMVSKPSVLCLTETWADKGLPSMRIEGYTLISRRDRADGRLGGGVAVFALERLARRVTLLENSQVAERSWVIIHSDHGPYVIGCWYRPPAPGEVDSIRSFKEEAQSHATNAVGCVLLGDLNIHHRKWLKYSNRNSLERQELCAVCKELGLTQLVNEPPAGITCLTWCCPASQE